MFFKYFWTCHLTNSIIFGERSVSMVMIMLIVNSYCRFQEVSLSLVFLTVWWVLAWISLRLFYLGFVELPGSMDKCFSSRFEKSGQLFLQIYLFALSLLLGFFFTCDDILDVDVVSELCSFLASLSPSDWILSVDSSGYWLFFQLNFYFTSYIFQLWVCIWFFPMLCISLLRFFIHCIIFHPCCCC